MKLLVVTQVVDRNDLALGFFHRWIEELASRVESVVVICLKEGVHSLPENVKVYSLGKEKGIHNRVAYATRFLKLVWRLRADYDTVFVHMNQEYVLLAGKLWWALRKPVYMWRNHYEGSWLTDVAAVFCKKVFCTSRFSYTAKYKKTVLMPVGVDVARFVAGDTLRQPRSILSFTRIAPSKRVEVLIDALAILKEKGVQFNAAIYGSPLPKDEGYYLGLKKRVGSKNLTDVVEFKPGVPNEEAPAVFRAHQISVNCARSGMFDKTLFEAAACGCIVLAASEDFASLAGAQAFFHGDAESLARALEDELNASAATINDTRNRLASVVEKNSLTALADQLVAQMS